MRPATGARTLGESRAGDPTWRATALAGTALIVALGVGLANRHHIVVSSAVALSGVVVAGFLLLPKAFAVVRRHPLVGVIALIPVLVFALAVLRRVEFGPADGGPSVPGARLVGRVWDLGRAAFLPLVLVTLAVTGGLVLIADALRSRLGTPRAALRAPWQRVTEKGGVPAEVPWRALAGVLLIGWAAFLGIGIAGRYVVDNRALEILLLVLIAGGAAVVIGTPLVIASLTRIDRDQADLAREDERQRFAAHLHDSVLQTLALVQRQAGDPVAVARLARRQEHALRAWMAGESELSSETLAAAVRSVVDGVEDEQEITVEQSIIGDRPLDTAGEALAAATREALRNAARHAGGSRILVFAELSADRAEVFVRDEGRGFELAGVATERRGIRDAIIGRMAAVGGTATVESAPGAGTEVAMRIGATR